jgi:hypothetical protein
MSMNNTSKYNLNNTEKIQNNKQTTNIPCSYKIIGIIGTYILNHLMYKIWLEI